jgi:hypothetical protein
MSKQGTANHRRLLRIFRRDGERCFWCKHPVKSHRQLRRMGLRKVSTDGYRVATVDHVRSRDEEGTNDLWNLVAACTVCNVERSRPGNDIDRGIAEGRYKLPARPSPLPTPQRAARPKVQRKAPLPVLDQAPYVERIPWTDPPALPTEPGLYLVVHPEQGRVLLVPVLISDGPYVAQGGQRRAWRPEWRWCPFEDLLTD